MGSHQPPTKMKGGLTESHDRSEDSGSFGKFENGVGPSERAKIHKGPLLIFYDLEWSFSDIIQIGASCEKGDFSQAVRPSGKVNYAVKKKIKLDVKVGPTGKRQVFDVKRRMFLPTLDPRDAFMDFLDWLEDLKLFVIRKILDERLKIRHGRFNFRGYGPEEVGVKVPQYL